MKLKQRPQDFRVTELLDFEQVPDGEYFVHRVRKERMDTLEALDRLARAAGVQRPALAYAGLKDRQAVTEQYVSIRGTRVDHEEEGLSCKFVGRAREAINSKQSHGNRFRIVVRDLSHFDAAKLRRNKASLQQQGLPNYFDDQRFGCLKHGQGLVALALAKGRPDEALRRLIARPPQSDLEDSGSDAKLRRLLALNWGDWITCGEIARGPMYDGIFEQLQRDNDFVAAIQHVPMRLKLIHQYSLQSFIWNRAVSRYLQRVIDERHQVWLESILGELCTWRYLEERRFSRLEELELPLIDANTRYEDARFGEAVESVLTDLGITQGDLARLDEFQGFALQEELRAVVLRPSDLEIGDPEADRRNDGRLAVELRFDLPRGAYATLCIRRLFTEPKRSKKRADEDEMPARGEREFRGRGREDYGARGRGREEYPRGGRRDDRGRGRDDDRGRGREESGARDRGRGDYRDRGRDDDRGRGRDEYQRRGRDDDRGRGREDYRSRGRDDDRGRGRDEYQRRGRDDDRSRGREDYRSRGRDDDRGRGRDDDRGRGRRDDRTRGREDRGARDRGRGDYRDRGRSDDRGRDREERGGRGRFEDRDRGRRDYGGRGRDDRSNRGRDDDRGRGRGEYRERDAGARPAEGRAGRREAEDAPKTPLPAAFKRKPRPAAEERPAPPPPPESAPPATPPSESSPPPAARKPKPGRRTSVLLRLRKKRGH